jgi:hypothetical protein
VRASGNLPVFHSTLPGFGHGTPIARDASSPQFQEGVAERGAILHMHNRLPANSRLMLAIRSVILADRGEFQRASSIFNLQPIRTRNR